MDDYKQKLVTMCNLRIPDGFDAIGPIEHPGPQNRRWQEPGMLIRNQSTGIYSLLTLGNSVRSLPQKDAAELASFMQPAREA